MTDLGSSSLMITSGRAADIAWEHRRVPYDGGQAPWCAFSGHRWPCQTHRLASTIVQMAADLAAVQAKVQRVTVLPDRWDERAGDCLVQGADGIADGLNEALHDLRVALAGEDE